MICSHILCVKSLKQCDPSEVQFSLSNGTRFPGAEFLFPLIFVLLLWRDFPATLDLEFPMFQEHIWG